MSLTSRHLMPDGLAFALKLINTHSLVSSTKTESKGFYKAIIDIKRKGSYSNIKAYIADVYILTASDVYEIMENHPEVNCIVVISNWDHYTDMAKQEARNYGIGLFTITEFMEALRYRGEKFLDTGCASKSEQTS